MKVNQTSQRSLVEGLSLCQDGHVVFFKKKCGLLKKMSLFLVPYNTKVQIIAIIQIASSKEIVHETKTEMTEGNALHRK